MADKGAYDLTPNRIGGYMTVNPGLRLPYYRLCVSLGRDAMTPGLAKFWSYNVAMPALYQNSHTAAYGIEASTAKGRRTWGWLSIGCGGMEVTDHGHVGRARTPRLHQIVNERCTTWSNSHTSPRDAGGSTRCFSRRRGHKLI